MSNSEVARNQLTFEERAKYFEKDVKEFFNSYKNESGGEDCIEVCLIQAGRRAIAMAEKEINRQKEEIKSLKSECQAADDYESVLVKRIKAEIYKEVFERLNKAIVRKNKFFGNWFIVKGVSLQDITALKKELEENIMSTPWGNETERADYYQNEFNTQFAICKRLDEENEKLKIENSSLSKEIIDTKIEMYKQCIEEMREKIVNTPVDVNLTGKTNEYREGYLDGLVAKQHNILDMLNNLLKELVGEDK